MIYVNYLRRSSDIAWPPYYIQLYKGGVMVDSNIVLIGLRSVIYYHYYRDHDDKS